MRDRVLVDACCGGRGPLAHRGGMSYAEYLDALSEFEASESAIITKRQLTKVRRGEFNGRRSQLVLVMIDSGVPYVCAHEGCESHEGLTIDHRIALSRGGTDELDNLQFLCKSHNSQKSDRKEVLA